MHIIMKKNGDVFLPSQFIDNNVIRNGIQSFSFLLSDDATVSFKDFADMIDAYYINIQARQIANEFRNPSEDIVYDTV